MILSEGRQRCPAHDGRRPSLSVTKTPEGRWLLHCFAGCAPEAVLRAAGLEWCDLSPDVPRRPMPPRPRSVRETIEGPLLARERRVQRRLAPWVPIYRISDFVRLERQAIAAARDRVSIAGDTDATWAELDQLARRARFVDAIEAELDAELPWMSG